VAYGKILPLELLQIPTKMCINVHGSLLPAYRGASPIQAALFHWEKETGVTIMQMSEGMDEGDMLKLRTIVIDPMETSESLFAKFALVSWPTLIQTLRELEHGGITPLPQDASQATYCKKIEKEDGLIDWTKSAEEIYHTWQAYTPWPGIYTMYEGKRLLLEWVSLLRHREVAPLCEALEVPLGWSDPANNKDSLWITGFLHPQEWQSNGAIGQVSRIEDGRIWIICDDWILTIEQVKLEWKKSQNIKDFVNGNQKLIWVIL
jgi:methionyl-tRNA formyltransferase